MLNCYGNFLFRYRNGIFPAVMILLLLGFRPVPLAGSASTDHWLDLAGLLVVMAGQALRAAVIGLAYIKRGGLNKRIHADSLVTEGLFRHCRNPLYVGNLLMLTGYFLMHNNPWVYLLGGGFFIISYHAIVTAEERFLREQFGQDYTDYCHRVSRWWIRLSGLKATFSGMHFNWRRVISKDYTTMLTWIITVLAIFSYENIVWGGVNNRYGLLATVSVIAIIAMLLALWIRVLKKQGRLNGYNLPAG
ncbi:MAG: methyltransferase family protein [Gammaproteobacteria bacterium]